MKTIWKFPLRITDEQWVSMPRGARVLSVQMQGDQACVWAIVESAATQEMRRLVILGTGNPIGDSGETLTFIGTFQQPPFVWHLFEATA